MRRTARQKEIKKRKNFLPLLGATLFLWVILTLFIYLVDPDSFGAIPAILIIVFITLFFTFTTIFARKRRGIITASTITIFLIFRYFGIGNILNFILLASIATAIEFYFWYTSH